MLKKSAELSCTKLLILNRNQITVDRVVPVKMGNSDISTPLHTLNIVELKVLLKHVASSINDLDRDGNSLLHRVLNDSECSVDIVTLLLYHGANINLVNKSGFSPLNCALVNCSREVIELLLDKGAVIGKTWRGTSLHLVLGRRGNNQKDMKYILKLLLNKSPDVNVFDCMGQTPMCIALGRHKVDIIQMLLDAGAQIKACLYHESPLHCYLGYFDDNIDMDPCYMLDNFFSLKVDQLKLLLNIGTDMNKVDYFGYTPLCIAFGLYEINVIKLLLDAGANVNGCKNHISSMHCYASSYNANNEIEVSLLKLLMAKGDDINKVNHDGQTPLCVAYLEQNEDSIVPLLNAGADINGCKYHISPLYCYVTQSDSLRMYMIKRFVDAGGDIHKVGDDGNTPLLLALKNCDCEISAICFMLDHKGGDINVRNKRGESVLHCALQNKSCLKLGIIKLLILRGAQIDAVTERGDIPLHDALKNHRCGPNIIKTLLNKGSPVNLINKFGRTPLGDVNFVDCNHDALKLLLAAGARIKGANGDKKLSILQQVIKVYCLKKSKQNLKCLKMFLKYSFLENPDMDIEGLFQRHKDYIKFSKFARKCVHELHRMETENVGLDFTLCEFLRVQMDTTGDFKQKGKDHDFNLLLKILAKRKYLVYLEVVLARIQRSYMIDKLQEITIYTRKSSPDFLSVKSKIILVYSSARYIAQYLSDSDLLNLIMAFHKSANSTVFGHSKENDFVGKRKTVKSNNFVKRSRLHL